MPDPTTWRTAVSVRPSGTPVSWQRPLFFMGSCFTDHLGDWLTRLRFRTMVNPFGILYNPVSVARALQRIAEGRPYTQEELFQSGECWCSPDHHGAFSHPDPAVCLSRINSALSEAGKMLKEASHLFLTLGSAVIYTLPDGRTVANCHKLPGSMFTVSMLSPSEAAGRLKDAVHAARSINPDIRIVFTVSPVRHYKDDLHRNTLSKSVLHLAVAELTEHEGCMYFPAFEIMQDDLRDYRFYATDLLHPGDLALDYLRKQFATAFMDAGTQQTISELEQLLRAAEHRPLHPETVSNRRFAVTTLERFKAFQQVHPDISLAEEIAALSGNKC